MLRLTFRLVLRLFALLRPVHVVAAGWVAAVVGLEVFGRRSPNDLLDALGVAALLSLGVATALAHRAHPLPLVAMVMRVIVAAWGTVSSVGIRVGVDLRHAPPIARAFPKPLAWGAAIAPLAAGGIALGHVAFPTEVRAGMLAGSATVYFLYLLILWSLLAGTALFMLLFTGACLHNWMVNLPRLQIRRRVLVEACVLTALFGTLVVAALVLPLLTPVVGIVVTGVVTVVAVAAPGAPALDLIWQRRAGGPVAVTGWHRLVAAVAILAAASVLVLTLLAVGDRLDGAGTTTLPITTFLGGAAAWCGFVGFFSWAWSFPLKTFVHRFRDPAKPQLIRVVVSGSEAIDTRRLATLRAEGFDPVFPGPRRSRDGVRIALDRDAPRPEHPGHHELPVSSGIRVHPDDLDHPDVFDAMHRLGEVEARRQLLSGLEELLRFADSRNYAHGHGFWIAPHYWFVTHMTRDTSEDDSWVVGPPYHRVLSPVARHHLYNVLRALEVDLVFVEDGIRLNQLRLVFRALFDAYDLFGAGRVEERHFDGLPGIRVVLHEFMMHEPFREKEYPEVDYEEIGRARILHVFHDRGGPEESTDVPIDSDLVGVPALV